MRPRLDVCIGLTAIFVVVVARAWLTHYPAAPFILAIGMPSASPEVGSHCGPWYRRTRLGRIPLRRWTCRLYYAIDPSVDHAEVTLDGLTRRAKSAERMWRLADSTSWQRMQDSLRTEFTRYGGVQRWCNHHRTLTHIRRSEAWQFSSYAVRMNAYSWRQRSGEQASWMLQLNAFPTALPPGYCDPGSPS